MIYISFFWFVKYNTSVGIIRMKDHSRGRGRGSRFGLALSQLGLGTLACNCSPEFTVYAPLGAERGEEVICLLGHLLVPCKGLAGQQDWRAEVHEDGARGEDHVAVALAVHGRAVALAEEAGLAVAKVLISLHQWWARWAADGGSHLPPTLQPLALFLLQLGLSGDSSCLEESLLAEVPSSCGPDGGLLLLHLGQPGQQLVGLALRHLGVSQPGVHGGRRGA